MKNDSRILFNLAPPLGSLQAGGPENRRLQNEKRVARTARGRVWASRTRMLCACLLLICGTLPVAAQQIAVSAAAAVVPPLVKFNGTLTSVESTPLSGVVGVTFSLYKDSEGGAALWVETQNVRPDKAGHYTVMLGSTSKEGLPANLFASGEARWLGVQAQGQEEQPRALLMSVPYALKALDAETVGGKPASAFMAATIAKSGSSIGDGSFDPTLTGGGTAHFIPIWKSSTKLGNSALFQTSGDVGIGTTTPSAKTEIKVANEGTLTLRLDSGSNSFLDVTPTNAGGRFQTVLNTVNNRDLIFLSGTGRVGMGTATPNAQMESVVASEGTLAMRLDSGSNSFLDITPTNVGGRFQTELSTANNRDLVILPGTGNVGIGQTGPAAKLEVVGPGEGSRALRLDSGANAFLDITPTNNGGRFQTVFDPVNNRDVVFAGGTQNVGIGTTAPTLGRLQITPNGGPALTVADPTNNFHMDVVPFVPASGVVDYTFVVKREDEHLSSNVLTLTQPTGHSNFCNGCVGIGTTSPANTLEVVAGGTTLADAWTVRSSRRFKTNIQPLEGALERVEQLRGVSYERKSDGKHEIGVIAEEVDQIVPEVVSRDPRTKEVQGVDYARLAALLIEAVKAQQAEILDLKMQVRQLTSSPAGQ